MYYIDVHMHTLCRAEFVIAIVPATLISLIPFPVQVYGPSGFWWYAYDQQREKSSDAI